MIDIESGRLPTGTPTPLHAVLESDMTFSDSLTTSFGSQHHHVETLRPSLLDTSSLMKMVAMMQVKARHKIKEVKYPELADTLILQVP